MMGEQPPAQNELFYDFNLEKRIPPEHLLRKIDQFLDFDSIRDHLQPFYSHTGRPSVDPELMIRMLLVGYCYGIRSERRLCEEVDFNLAYRWFCRMGLEDDVPNHSTFSKNRHGRFRDSDTFRFVFESVLQRCMTEGLVKGEGFAIDASLVRADVAKNPQPNPQDNPFDWTSIENQSRAVREYLEALDEEPALRREQKKVSLTDPMAQWNGSKGPAEFYYSTNYLIDVKFSIIMDVEPSASTLGQEVATTKPMIERVQSNCGILPDRLMGDTAYGAAENLGYVVEEKGIEPHIPVWDKTERTDGTLSVSDFQWDEEADEYRCPASKTLRRNRRKFKVPRSDINKDNTITYRAGNADCEICPLKPTCCPNTPSRKIKRSVHEKSRDVARAIYKSGKYEATLDERKKVEMTFAHMKRHLNFNRLRLRGLKGARDEFLLVATAHNLRKLVSLCAQPPPDLQGSCA